MDKGGMSQNQMNTKITTIRPPRVVTVVDVVLYLMEI